MKLFSFSVAIVALVSGELSLTAVASAADASSSRRAPEFDHTTDSLKRYRTPEWFRDAKFGIWAHWGPQAVPGQGDWYARQMYVEVHRHYLHHLKTYGHPSKSGYKDIIPLWKAEKWEPEALMDLYAKAGARYFVSMGVHHDNFDLWDSNITRGTPSKWDRNATSSASGSAPR